jgi:hypothetical protein
MEMAFCKSSSILRLDSRSGVAEVWFEAQRNFMLLRLRELPQLTRNGFSLLVQLRVLRFRLLQYRDIGIGVLPGRKECRIRFAGLPRITSHLVGAAALQMGEDAQGKVGYDTAMVDQLLEFSGSLHTVARA